MWKMPFFTTDFYHAANWFLLYSMLGWLLESIYMSFCNKRLTNRGFVRGPICPIYGVGFLGAYFLFKPIAHNWLLLYVVGCVSATALEFLVAQVMLKTLGPSGGTIKKSPLTTRGSCAWRAPWPGASTRYASSPLSTTASPGSATATVAPSESFW